MSSFCNNRSKVVTINVCTIKVLCTANMGPAIASFKEGMAGFLVAVAEGMEMVEDKRQKVKHRSAGRQLLLGLLGMLVLASGCQSAPAVKQAGLDNSRFMSLWETYTRCKGSSDLEQAARDARLLTEAAQLRTRHDGFVLPLPMKLERYVNHPTNRFAVDVPAMASFCSLHAGQLALDRGRVDVARDLFSAVLALYPPEESSYYLLQARTFLAELEHGLEVSLNAP